MAFPRALVTLVVLVSINPGGGALPGPALLEPPALDGAWSPATSGCGFAGQRRQGGSYLVQAGAHVGGGRADVAAAVGVPSQPISPSASPRPCNPLLLTSNALFLVLGGVALLVGGLGIANVTLLSVLEQVSGRPRSSAPSAPDRSR